MNTDANANFGPPDKNEQFQPPQSKMAKKPGNIVQEGKNVEVLYSDGLWYKGWLSSYNFETEKWFYDDDETIEVSFPREFGLLNKPQTISTKIMFNPQLFSFIV